MLLLSKLLCFVAVFVGLAKTQKWLHFDAMVCYDVPFFQRKDPGKMPRHLSPVKNPALCQIMKTLEDFNNYHPTSARFG